MHTLLSGERMLISKLEGVIWGCVCIEISPETYFYSEIERSSTDGAQIYGVGCMSIYAVQ